MSQKPKSPVEWDELDTAVQEALTEWYNVSKLEYEDKERLAKLYEDGKFFFWKCPSCKSSGDDTMCYVGRPDDWGDFQGVLQNDYTSFPGSPDVFTPKMIAAMCDNCRCHLLSDVIIPANIPFIDEE